MIYGINDGHTLTGVGTGAAGIVKETDKNREVGKRLREMLKEKEHTVINCTVDKSNNDLVDACNIANKQYLDLFISLHLNAFDNSSANGIETYSLSATGKGAEFSKKIQTELVKSIGWYNRGCKTANFYVLKNTTAPAVLLELGFCTNRDDMNKWNTENICKAIFKAITGNEYINNTPAPIPPSNSNEMYRVRKTWEDATSQKGAFSDLNNAKKCADENPGHSVFDSKGTNVYNGASITVGSIVRITGTHYATGQVISEWAKTQDHIVQEISGDRALLKEITSWCFIKDLKIK